jgi:F0F1-type ATP synthase assembly protein I
MNRSSGAYELVVSPLILAGLAFLIDRWIGTTPVLTVIAALLGLAGAVIKLYYVYGHEMARHDDGAPWAARAGRDGDDDA